MSQNWRIITNQVDNTNSEGNANTSGYGQISVLLSKYVLKVKGKDLSTNDFTDNLYNKLESIETDAQVNKLETISINGGNPIEADSNKNINLGVLFSGVKKIIEKTPEALYKAFWRNGGML